MAIRAVVFDLGGVLEHLDGPDALWGPWRDRLGLTEAEMQVAGARVDPDELIEIGGLSESEYRQRYADAFRLTGAETDRFMRDMWDWYCGELDEELVAYATSLRPRYATAILSNSADGARREEQARFGLEDLVDTIIYSHEVGIAKPDRRVYLLTCERLSVRPEEAVLLDDVQTCVDGAQRVGMQALLHRDTATSIAAINGLLRR